MKKTRILRRDMGGSTPAAQLSEGKAVGQHFKNGGCVANLRVMEKKMHSEVQDAPFMKKMGVTKENISNSLPRSATLPKRATGGRLFIQNAIKNPGALHKSLGVPSGKKISEAKLLNAERSRSPLTRKRAILAETLKKTKK